ncbi:MAG: hypothetical protein PVG41_17240 [Desulfobacteraceae bacterium]|jgi:hypothetical protein
MRRGELIGNLILFSPIILFTIVSIASSLVIQAPIAYYFLSLGLLMIGFVSLLKAKLPNFKNKQYITFGTKGITTTNSFFYYIGATSTGIGTILSFGLLFWVSIQ